MRHWKTIAILMLLMSGAGSVFGDDDAGKLHVVGYLPDYRLDKTDPGVCRQLTDLIIFSVRSEPNGEIFPKAIESPQTAALMKQIREQSRVKIFLCVGGWDRSQGFAEISASAESRQKFANNLVTYCKKHTFDGVDIDWEHPQNDQESTNYGLMLEEITRQFKPHGYRLTIALAAWQKVTPTAIEAVDAFHLMSYDGDGPHSTFEMARSDVQRLIDQGVPRAKIRLGLPFYGRGVTNRNAVKTYAEIVAAQSRPLNLEKLNSDDFNGLSYNGPATIRSKTEWARSQKLNGVMIWEIGQDATGEDSLLKVILKAVN